MSYWDLLSHVFTGYDDLNLSINTDMVTIVRAMAQPESGLEIRDRMWLKITIPNAFIGTWHMAHNERSEVNYAIEDCKPCLLLYV